MHASGVCILRPHMPWIVVDCADYQCKPTQLGRLLKACCLSFAVLWGL